MKEIVSQTERLDKARVINTSPTRKATIDSLLNEIARHSCFEKQMRKQKAEFAHLRLSAKVYDQMWQRADSITVRLENREVHIKKLKHRADSVKRQIENLQKALKSLSSTSGALQYTSDLIKTGSDLAQALSRIRELATRDELTGLINRRHLRELMEQEHQRCIRSGHSFCLAVLDIDGFKALNDKHGRVIGDTVLRSVAHEGLRLVRVSDVFARWGGDRFVLLMSDTRSNLARSGVERELHHAAHHVPEPLRSAAHKHHHPSLAREVEDGVQPVEPASRRNRIRSSGCTLTRCSTCISLGLSASRVRTSGKPMTTCRCKRTSAPKRY